MMTDLDQQITYAQAAQQRLSTGEQLPSDVGYLANAVIDLATELDQIRPYSHETVRAIADERDQLADENRRLREAWKELDENAEPTGFFGAEWRQGILAKYGVEVQS